MEEMGVQLARMTLSDVLRWRVERWAQAAEASGMKVHPLGAQAAVARAAGIDKGTLNAAINDRKPLGMEAALALSRTLGIPPMVMLLLVVQDREGME